CRAFGRRSTKERARGSRSSSPTIATRRRPRSIPELVTALRRSATALGLVLAAANLHAAEPPLLHALFSDHAVLPRGRPIAVWGTATAGDEVTVSFAGARVVAKADAAGGWSATLPAQPAGGPHELSARAHSGATQTVRDVLVGDVWLCSGQS